MGIDEQEREGCFPIRELSLRTGVNTVTLRAWERRYGLLKPKRTAKGHRLYDDADVALVNQVLHWIERGIPVGQVKPLLSEDPPAHQLTPDNFWAPLIELLCEAAARMAGRRIDAVLHEQLLSYPASVVVLNWLQPVMERLTRQTDLSAALYLEAQLLRYAQRRCDPAAKRQWLLIVGEGTPLWPLTLLSLALSATGGMALILPQPVSLATLGQINRADGEQQLLYFQDGRWSEEQLELLSSLNTREMILCGSAPMLAQLPLTTVYASPLQLLNERVGSEC